MPLRPSAEILLAFGSACRAEPLLRLVLTTTINVLLLTEELHQVENSVHRTQRAFEDGRPRRNGFGAAQSTGGGAFEQTTLGLLARLKRLPEGCHRYRSAVTVAVASPDASARPPSPLTGTWTHPLDSTRLFSGSRRNDWPDITTALVDD